MHKLFNTLATILMFADVLYAIRTFMALKEEQKEENQETRSLSWIGLLYVFLLMAFAAGYVIISITNLHADGLTANVIAQLLFWGAVFVFVSIYVFRTLLNSTKQELQYRLSDLQISLDTYIKSIPGGVHHCVVEPELRVSYVSKGFTDITGYTIEDIDRLGNGKYTCMIYEEDQDAFVAAVRHLLKTMAQVTVNYRVVTKRGDLIWVQDVMNAIRDSKGHLHIFAVVLDVTREKQQAEKDALTGLLNKGAFRERCLEYMHRHPDDQLGLFMIDLNFFKEVNDHFGHPQGDIILIKSALCIKDAFATEDAIIGRIGGDEFMVLVKDAHSEEQLTELKQRLTDSFRITIPDIQDFPTVTASVGCHLADCSEDFETIYRSADLAMYDEKEAMHAGRKSFLHKTLEERAADFGGKLELDGEFDCGIPEGREYWPSDDFSSLAPKPQT